MELEDRCEWCSGHEIYNLDVCTYCGAVLLVTASNKDYIKGFSFLNGDTSKEEALKIVKEKLKEQRLNYGKQL